MEQDLKAIIELATTLENADERVAKAEIVVAEQPTLDLVAIAAEVGIGKEYAERAASIITPTSEAVARFEKNLRVNDSNYLKTQHILGYLRDLYETIESMPTEMYILKLRGNFTTHVTPRTRGKILRTADFKRTLYSISKKTGWYSWDHLAVLKRYPHVLEVTVTNVEVLGLIDLVKERHPKAPLSVERSYSAI